MTAPDRIVATLANVERAHGVRIALAVESGSRAWGFPSVDSDWDVRFLYLRPLPAYLGTEAASDVIDLPLTGDLDFSGWDLRKGLALLVQSNAAVLEWLGSPIVYRADETIGAAMAELARSAADIPTLAYHYDHIARRHWTAGPGRIVRSKTLFYGLRSALARAWLDWHRTPPPMDLPRLIAGLPLPAALIATIERLRTDKLAATEADIVAVPSAVDAFIAEALADPAPRAERPNTARLRADADAIFFRAVVGRSA